MAIHKSDPDTYTEIPNHKQTEQHAERNHIIPSDLIDGSVISKNALKP